MESTIKQYATRRDDGRNEAHRSLRSFANLAVCDADDEVYEIELTECSESDKWDFIGFRYDARVGGDGGVELVWPDREGFELCFESGSASDVKLGRGEVVHMQIINENPMGRAGSLGRAEGAAASGGGSRNRKRKGNGRSGKRG